MDTFRGRRFFALQGCNRRKQGPRWGATHARKGWPGMLVMLALLLTLAACSSGTPAHQASAPTPISTPTLTPTQAVPGGTVLYHTDWSQGLAGWSVPGAMTAQASKGQLHLICGEQASMSLGYRPAVANYALEVPVQIVSIPHNGGTFALVDQRGPGKDGYVGGAADLAQKFPFHGQFTTYLEPLDDSSAYYTADFSPGTSWLTYRIEVQNGEFSFFLNGVRHGEATSNQNVPLADGPLGMNCAGAVLNLGPLTMTAL